MQENNNKDTEQCTLHGVISRYCYGQVVYSKRQKKFGTIKEVCRNGLLLVFSKNKYDYEFTYFKEIGYDGL